ncbi:MAG: YeiH family protein [Proteobacteria bacterium]|nr:YeiH family protein [Pseudomonadota bacterium]MBU2226521.1 YeiH family protein [Pseudomonadota bacterium]MBU2260658.1 YeiH family protein [Pseudomonadota bacterium]
MAEKSNGINWSVLWKSDDWMSVWIGFFILIFFLAGATMSLPKWKWIGDGSFQDKIVGYAKKVDSAAKDAEAKAEIALKDQAAALKAALDAKDRKAIGAAAGKMEAAAKEVKDKDFQKKTAKLAAGIKGDAGATVGKVFSGENLMKALYLFIGLAILGVIGMAFMGLPVVKFMAGFPIVFILSALAYFVADNDIVSFYGLEVVFWALIFGLLISNIGNVPAWLKTAVKTEYFIKIGLVLLGAEVLFGTVAKVGAYGMVQAILVIGVVFYFCIWFARKVGLDDEFASIIGASVSICGVSAAIAAGGAVKGDSKKVSHCISLVLLCAMPMLILMPIIAKAVGMSPAVAGAWLGGTIDTTGAVVAAGAIAGPEAMSVAVVVKMAQNVLIGLAAFLLALWFTFKGHAAGGEKPSLMELWTRFPKFVLGFIVASIVFSFFMSEAQATSVTGITKGLRGWWFTLAFLCIGLETKFSELVKMGGGKPALVFLTAQAVNIFWTLLLAYLIFGGILFPAPTF